MKELLQLIAKFDIKNLFKTPTDNTFIQFFRYLFVGGIAFLVDAGSLFLLELAGLHYLMAAGIAFLIGLVCNFIMSKLLVFQEKKDKPQIEFAVYGIIGVMGLGITEGLMYLFTDVAGVYFMLSKIVVAIIVLMWNFFARKFILYRKKDKVEQG